MLTHTFVCTHTHPHTHTYTHTPSLILSLRIAQKALLSLTPLCLLHTNAAHTANPVKVSSGVRENLQTSSRSRGKHRLGKAFVPINSAVGNLCGGPFNSETRSCGAPVCVWGGFCCTPGFERLIKESDWLKSAPSRFFPKLNGELAEELPPSLKKRKRNAWPGSPGRLTWLTVTAGI